MIIPHRHRWSRWVLGSLAIGLMLLLYIFQQKILWFPALGHDSRFVYVPFIVNRMMRMVLNDSLCLLLFLAIFNQVQELKLASLVFIVELFLILPFYFLLKLSVEGDSEISTPLLSFIHRLIVNPLLMIILLGGLLYQRYSIEKNIRDGD